MYLKKTDFSNNLKSGERLELALKKTLQEYLPDNDIIITPQNLKDRKPELGIVDILVRDKDKKILFGVECKLGETKFQACKKYNGWDGDYNCPINKTSFATYRTYSYPVFLFNLQSWTKELQVELISSIERQNPEVRKVDYKRTDILNFCTYYWFRSKNIKETIQYIVNTYANIR